jgi:hypothetical protein
MKPLRHWAFAGVILRSNSLPHPGFWQLALNTTPGALVLPIRDIFESVSEIFVNSMLLLPTNKAPQIPCRAESGLVLCSPHYQAESIRLWFLFCFPF